MSGGIFPVGIFEYILEMSNDANRRFSLYGICSRSSINCIEFLTLNEYGKGM
jgi:hypothetical protein